MPSARSSHAPSDDVALVLRCRAGDAQAWRVLVERYESLVYTVARSFGLGTHDAADVLQSTFESLLRGIDGIDRSERLGAWLTTVAKRQSIRLVGRHDRIVAPLSDSVAAEEPGFDRVDGADRVLQALAVLSEPCRRLIAMLYFTATPPTYDEVSAELQIPVGSIGPTRARCLEQMRRSLGSR